MKFVYTYVLADENAPEKLSVMIKGVIIETQETHWKRKRNNE